MPKISSWTIPAKIGSLIMAGFLLIPVNMNASKAPMPKNGEYVILLHGMGRTKFSMKKLQTRLSENGYQVVNEGYPSTREPVGVIAEQYLHPMVTKCLAAGAGKIHIVTHSLGGIVVRQYLQTHTLPEGSRIVMISPPNKGSELVDFFRSLRIYRWLSGPAGQALGTEAQSLPNSLKPVRAEIGVITGKSTLNPFFSWLIPGEDDGKVSVERAKLAEMKGFFVVSSSHSFIMNNDKVLCQTIYFLKNGGFNVCSTAVSQKPKLP